MQLPGAERAFINPPKLLDYLLSPEHPVGRTKARFFAALWIVLNEEDFPRLVTAYPGDTP